MSGLRQAVSTGRAMSDRLNVFAGEARQPEIIRLLEEQDRAAHNLHDALGELAERLGSVLSEARPSDSEVLSKSLVESSLGRRIDALTERAETATGIIRSLISRLEV